MRDVALAVAALLAVAAAASAEAPLDELDRTETALQKSRAEQRDLERRAAAARDEMNRLRRALVAAGGSTRERESGVAEIESRLADLEAEEAAKRADLMARRDQFDGLLFTLQRMARYPPEALIVLPRDPNDTVRGAILMRAALPEIEARSAILRRQLESLTATRRALARERDDLVAARDRLTDERGELDQLLARKAALFADLRQQGASARAAVARLAAKSRDLRDLVRRLDAERTAARLAAVVPAAKPRLLETTVPVRAVPAPASGLPISRSRGRLPQPVNGRVVTSYGSRQGKGPTAKGLTFETRPGARVVAPHGGKIVFAGPFRGYGRLLIIEHGEGYHTLLSGMARIDGAIGQTVLTGEPVGVMETSGIQRPRLYLELRRDSQPINPRPWLTAQKGKANG